MGDSDMRRVSIERCRELLGADDGSLSNEAIERIRTHAETLARLLIDICLDQQQRERSVRTDQPDAGSIPVWSKEEVV